ncbi:MAG: OsmC family protein [Candidatus Dormibacteria bacterium]|jgi:osmotically inducible protein OsmC
MPDLTFASTVRWQGRGRDGGGTVTTGGQTLDYSAPSSMGGRGLGTSPEELLVSAVASCYSGTLFHLLARDGLPADDVAVDAVGVVIDHPSRAARFSRIVVNPTITGADSGRLPGYQACARVARDHCFIGAALHTAIDYEVGEVRVRSRAPEVAQ